MAKTKGVESKHKNNNSILGNFVIYIIYLFESIFKVGKADTDRITKSSNLPTRIHQQVRKLVDEYGRENVEANIDYKVENITTSDAKKLEEEILQNIFDETNKVPRGNQKSFKPKKK